MKDEKTKKDEYQKALAAYTEAMKEFRKAKFDKAVDLLRAFIEKHPAERELVDRARTYLAICREPGSRSKGEPDALKTVEDYYHYGVYKMNARRVRRGPQAPRKGGEARPRERRPLRPADLLCRMGQTDDGLEALKKAVQIDKSFRILAQNETDFEPLWEDKRFKAMTRIGMR